MSSTNLTATFAVELKDQTSGAAKDAGDSLAQLKAKIEADKKALSEMQRAMGNLKGGTSTSVAAFKQLRDQITAQKASIAQAQSAYIEAGGTFEAVGKKLPDAPIKTLGESVQGLPGPIGDVSSRFSRMKSSAMEVGKALGLTSASSMLAAAAVVGLVAGLGLLVIAAASAVASLLKLGIANSDARRSELLHLEAVGQLRRGLGDAAGRASEAQAAIDSVSASSALSRGAISGYAETLLRAGLRGEDLETALSAAAAKGSALGEAAGTGAAQTLGAMHRAGMGVDGFASRIQSRFGGIARRQAMSFGVQMDKLRESFAGITDGLDLEPFLGALRGLTQMFSQSTSAGKAMREMFTSIFQDFMTGATGAVEIMKQVLRSAIITGLELTIGFRRAQIAMLIMATIAKRTVTRIAAAFGVSVNWSNIGRNIVSGIVNGILAATPGGVGAMARLASQLKEGLEDALEIQSPSRVFAELGRQIPAGVAVGVQDGSSVATGAVSALLDETVAPSGAGVGGARTTISIGDIYVQTSSQDGRGIAADLRAELARLLEADGFALGAA
jgi:hypothetical protein